MKPYQLIRLALLLKNSIIEKFVKIACECKSKEHELSMYEHGTNVAFLKPVYYSSNVM